MQDMLSVAAEWQQYCVLFKLCSTGCWQQSLGFMDLFAALDESWPIVAELSCCDENWAVVLQPAQQWLPQQHRQGLAQHNVRAASPQALTSLSTDPMVNECCVTAVR